jgi:spore coat polysaccharide biosynthesis protein SpsF (cytidylyltransferase family)
MIEQYDPLIAKIGSKRLATKAISLLNTTSMRVRLRLRQTKLEKFSLLDCLDDEPEELVPAIWTGSYFYFRCGSKE